MTLSGETKDGIGFMFAEPLSREAREFLAHHGIIGVGQVEIDQSAEQSSLDRPSEEDIAG